MFIKRKFTDKLPLDGKNIFYIGKTGLLKTGNFYNRGDKDSYITVHGSSQGTVTIDYLPNCDYWLEELKD